MIVTNPVAVLFAGCEARHWDPELRVGFRVRAVAEQPPFRQGV